MCHHCVIESVKDRMLSRRSLFRGAAVAGSGAVATAAGLGATGPAAAQVSGGSPVDLTFDLYPEFPTYFGEPGVSSRAVYNFADHGFNLLEVTVNEHTGTHMDAPLHFSADGHSVDEIPVADLVVPLAIVDIREKAAADPDAQVTPDDLAAWQAAHGDFPDRCCVAMLSGWDSRADGDGYRNADADGTMHFPGFHVEAAQMLIERTSAVGIGVDTLSLDHGPSADFATHYAWLPTNRWGMECLNNLAALPAVGATLILGAPKLRGGTGGPTRAIALA